MSSTTDQELKALYIAKIDTEWEDDEEWQAQCFFTMRRAINASTLDKAIRILRAGDWGSPGESAVILRKTVRCLHCHGTGYVS